MTENYLLLGGTGYIGLAFQDEFVRRGTHYRNVSRSECDYTSFASLLSLLRDARPTFLVNCAGYTGKPNVDACETSRAETLLGNVALPQTIAHACEVAGVPWGHVSSGCIYTGAKLRVEKGSDTDCAGNRGLTPFQLPDRILPNLMLPEVQAIWQQHRSVLSGFTEVDTPNFSFRSPPCSFYSGSKAIGEEVLANAPNVYIWRLRIPFDSGTSPRNYLSKIWNYPRVYDNANSLSHRGDFAKACLDLWELRVPFGIYNVTNPGWITTRDVAAKLRVAMRREQDFDFFENDHEFYKTAALTPRSNTILDTSKILATGIQFRSVEEALDEAIKEYAAKSESLK